MPSPYMPDVLVEIAFNAGFSTPPASRTWTDVSSYVEAVQGITITHGRQDERSTADANTLSLVLDNSDGRFTAGRASSPYSPNVKLGRPVRVTVTPSGGVASRRFFGYVDEWPVEWDGSDAYSFVTLSASSRMAQMGNGLPLRSVVEEEIDYDAPVLYYTFGEPEGPSAHDSSGSNGPLLTQFGSGTAVSFGVATGPGTDGLTAAQFAGGKYLRAATLGTATSGVGAFFLRTAAPAASEMLLERGSGADAASVYMNTAGQVVANYRGTTVTSASSFADGATHHVAMLDAPALRLYVDGVLVGSATVTPGVVTDGLNVGGNGTMATFTGTIAHVAVYDATPAPSRFADHADAGLDGFQGETAAQRAARYARWTGLATSEMIADASTIAVAHVATTGASALDLLRLMETTEDGVLFDDRDGVLRLRNRTHRDGAPLAVTLSVAAQQVQSDYAARLDRSTLVNDVRASITTSSGAVLHTRATSNTSIADYGTVVMEIETASTSILDAYTLAQRLISKYAEPRPRVPSLTVDVLNCNVDLAVLLGLNVSSKLAVDNLPSQAAYVKSSFFVEGYTETITNESYLITFNVSPA